jgi:hypothetical protein
MDDLSEQDFYKEIIKTRPVSGEAAFLSHFGKFINGRQAFAVAWSMMSWRLAQKSGPATDVQRGAARRPRIVDS